MTRCAGREGDRWRATEHQVFLEELLGCQLDVVGGQVHDGEVEVPVRGAGAREVVARLDHDGVDPGMLLTEAVEEAGHEPSGRWSR